MFDRPAIARFAPGRRSGYAEKGGSGRSHSGVAWRDGAGAVDHACLGMMLGRGGEKAAGLSLEEMGLNSFQQSLWRTGD